MASAKTRQIYFPALWGFSQKLLLFCFKTSEIHTKAAINLAPLNGLAQKMMKKFLDISNTSERIWFLLKSTIGISLHKRLVRFRISGFLSGSQGLLSRPKGPKPARRQYTIKLKELRCGRFQHTRGQFLFLISFKWGTILLSSSRMLFSILLLIVWLLTPI